MTNCLGKSYSFGLLCAPFVNVYQFVWCFFPFWFESGIGDFIVLVPDHCLSIYFPSTSSYCRHLFYSFKGQS